MNLKKFIASVVITTMLLSNTVAAQNVPSPDLENSMQGIKDSLPPAQLLPGEKDPGMALSPMKKAQRAPFTGVLLSPAAVADIIVEFESIEERIHIEVVRAVKEEQATCEKNLKDAEARSTADKKELHANLEAKKTEAQAYKDELKRLKDTQPNPYFWAGLGTLGGAAFTLLTVFAISQVAK